jgi:hypothetical protein
MERIPFAFFSTLRTFPESEFEIVMVGGNEREREFCEEGAIV